MPAFKRDITGQIDGRAVISRLDGAAYRPNPDQVHKVMMNAAALPGSMAIELPDETVNEIAFFGYQERLLPLASGGGRGWVIDFEATQFRILTVVRDYSTPAGYEDQGFTWLHNQFSAEPCKETR